jgi:uncharacterized protein YcnI
MSLRKRRRAVAKMRVAAGLTAIAGVGLFTGATVAEAHVSVEPARAPAGGEAKLKFSVGHGCDGSPTTSITIQLPDQVVSAKPQAVPGWKTANSGREVGWKGGNLDPHQLQVFVLKASFDGKPREIAPFKVLQRCQEGEIAWIEIPEQGQPEPEHPAPVVKLVAGRKGHAETNEAVAEDTAAAVDDTATTETATDSEDNAAAEDDTTASDTAADEAEDGDGNSPLPVIALVLAVVALLAAGAAYFKRRS